MKKLLLRMGVLLAVFIASFALYYRTIDEHTETQETLSTGLSTARLPVVSFLTGGREINPCEGSTILLDGSCPRDSITPVSTEQRLGILIDRKATNVRKMEIALLDIPGISEIEKHEVTAFGNDNGRLSSEIVFEGTLTADTEYLLKATLIDSEGRKIYYYTRLLVANYGSLAGSLDYVADFHAKTFDKEKVYELDTYMETEDDRVNSDFSHVDIRDDLDTLSYGTLAPSEVYRFCPIITEYNSGFVSVCLYYWLSAYTDSGLETYQCREGYRFKYNDQRCILYNYDRYMDAEFDGGYYDNSKSGLKLGICRNKDIDGLLSADKTKYLFSYQGTLWELDMTKNTLTTVLSYREKGTRDRQPDPQYDFTLLSVDDEGNADFAVYGRIGKGDYEGRRGIIYYHFFAEENRIEERMYIPVNLDLEELNDAFGRVSYTSEMGIFYFTLFDSYYSYELDTNVLRTEVENMGENWLYFEDKKLLVFNENPDAAENKRIVLLDVVNNKCEYIGEGSDIVNLLGTVDGRVVYGNSKPELISFFADGSTNVPYKKLYIADTDGTVVKEYVPEEGLYVCGIEFTEGMISLQCFRLESPAAGNDKATFSFVTKDVIINLYKSESVTKTYSSASNPKTRTEYYLTLPSSYVPEKVPAYYTAASTVVTKDTSAAVKTEAAGYFRVSVYGSEELITEDIGTALTLADEIAGTVTDPDGRVIWRRSITESEKKLSGSFGTAGAENLNASQAVLAAVFAYYGSEADAAGCSVAEKPMFSWIRELTGKNAYYTENATLSSLLYFVSDGNPLVVSYENGYVLVTAYTKGTVTCYDPVTGESRKLTREKAEEAFKIAGGRYIVIY